MEIVQIPVLNDNYVYLAHDGDETAVIDPAVAEPVLAAAAARGWTITQILNTHWHPDHVGANLAIKAATGCRITGPAGEAAQDPRHRPRGGRRRHGAGRRRDRAGDRRARAYGGA